MLIRELEDVSGVILLARNVGDQQGTSACLVFLIITFTIMLVLLMSALELLSCPFLLRDCANLANLVANIVHLLNFATSVHLDITFIKDGVIRHVLENCNLFIRDIIFNFWELSVKVVLINSVLIVRFVV